MRQILSTDPHVVTSSVEQLLLAHPSPHSTSQQVAQRKPRPGYARPSTSNAVASWIASSHSRPQTLLGARSEDVGDEMPGLSEAVALLHAKQRLERPGLNITILAKQRSTQAPFWDAVVAPAVGCRDMMVESWLHGQGRLNDSCGQAGCVVNGAGVRFAQQSWTVEQDHAKWSLCCDQAIACFGDMNREWAQQFRGGLAVCMQGGADSADGLYGWLRAHARSVTPTCKHCTC